jgi:hypothetical protein
MEDERTFDCGHVEYFPPADWSNVVGTVSLVAPKLDDEGYRPCHCEDYPCCGH